MVEIYEIPDNVAECPHCHTLVKYDREDLKGGYEFTGSGTIHWTYIECPKCKNQIQF